MSKHYLIILAIFAHILLSASSLSVDLFHRDSPQSPLYNHSLSEWDRVNNAVKRSINPKLGPSNGDQLMQISVGTPPKQFTVIANTRDSTTWVQCKPCISCYKQTDPIFDPSQSSTYKGIACSTPVCENMTFSIHGCDTERNVCTFQVTYRDASQGRGDVGTDTLTIGSATTANMPFGCGRKNANEGYLQSAAGVAGLGPRSAILDFGDLSYCIASFGSTGKISFGNRVSGSDTVTTQLAMSAGDVAYRVALESIKVGETTLAYPKKSLPRGVVLDTTSMVSKLPIGFFNQLKRELVKSTNGKPREDPLGIYPLCYGVRDNIEFPKLSAQFSGAELKLETSNMFVRTSPDLMCLAVFPSHDDLAHLGYLFQTNFLIGFDTSKGEVSFKPMDCGKL